MYAVVETGGKQYKVEKGTSLLVDRLSAKEGADSRVASAQRRRSEPPSALPREPDPAAWSAT